MWRSCVHVYVHFIWRTWDGQPCIDISWEERLHASIAGEARAAGCHAVRVGGTSDHVHAIVRMSATATIADVAKRMKGGSSHFVTHVIAPAVAFRWQGTYGAFSVQYENVQTVVDYIARQREHHAAETEQPEWEQSSEHHDQNEAPP